MGSQPEDVIARACRGDATAQRVLVRRYLRLVWGLCLYHLGDPVEAGRLARKILERSLSDLDSIPDPRRLRSWLAVRTLDAIRETQATEGRSREGEGARGLVGEGALESLQRLPDHLRRPLTLRYFEGFSYARIGARIGSGLEQVDDLLRRAKEKIRETPSSS